MASIKMEDHGDLGKESQEYEEIRIARQNHKNMNRSEQQGLLNMSSSGVLKFSPSTGLEAIL